MYILIKKLYFVCISIFYKELSIKDVHAEGGGGGGKIFFFIFKLIKRIFFFNIFN